MKRSAIQILAVAVALAMGACSAGGSRTANQHPPPLSWHGAEQLMLRADDVRSSAPDALQAIGLADAFRGSALQMLQAQKESLERRGLREEERNSTRTLVFWDQAADEAVLQVLAQGRLVSPDQPSPAWAETARQWWVRLQYADGAWWVVDQADLTPDRWRRATA